MRLIAALEQVPSSDRLPIAAEVQTLLAAGDRSGAAALITSACKQIR